MKCKKEVAMHLPTVPSLIRKTKTNKLRDLDCLVLRNNWSILILPQIKQTC